MLPASTNGGGQCVATAPDVCKTPTPAGPVPTPYPNIAQVNQATNTATKVKFTGRPVVHKMSEIPMSSGDEAGTVGGIVSGVNMNKVIYKIGSSKVKVEGQQCEFHTALTGHNGANSNIVGMQAAPSQVKVLVSP